MTAFAPTDSGDDTTRERDTCATRATVLARPTRSTVLATLAAFAFVVVLIALL